MSGLNFNQAMLFLERGVKMRRACWDLYDYPYAMRFNTDFVKNENYDEIFLDAEDIFANDWEVADPDLLNTIAKAEEGK